MSVARRCAIGLDVGGTKIAGGVVGWDGEVLERKVIPAAPSRGGQAVLDDALSLAKALKSRAAVRGFHTVAVGVGVCELVDQHGTAVSEQTIRWRGWPIRESFNAVAPSLVEADSRAAAFGEACCGAGQPFASFIYATVGTGIGGSWVVNRIPWPGSTGCSGTLASSPMTVLCPECRAPRSAVLEDVASGPALVMRYNARSGASARCAQDVLAAAEAGDSHAQWVVSTAAESLGAVLALLVNVLDPAAVVVGGGLGSAPGPFWRDLTDALRRHIWAEVRRDLPILQAARGADSGVVGAALLAWKALAPSGCPI